MPEYSPRKTTGKPKVPIAPKPPRRRRQKQVYECCCCRQQTRFCWTCECGLQICQACMQENLWGLTCNYVDWECPDCGAWHGFGNQ